MSQSVSLRWLGSVQGARPVTFGLPWKRGELQKGSPLSLRGSGGEIPMSSWPTAYWPDGSVKWSAHTAVVDGAETGLRVEHTPPAPVPEPVRVQDLGGAISVETGTLRCEIPKSGGLFLKGLVRAGRSGPGMDGRLFCRIRTKSREGEVELTRDETCAAEVQSAEIEQQSANRCCVKLTGAHRQTDGSLPFLFTLRIYFYSGSGEVGFVHSLVVGIDDSRELSGLAAEFSVPMQGEPYNRHVAFAGESGIYFEGAQGLLTNDGRGRDYYYAQQKLEFVTIQPVDEESKWFAENVYMAAFWKNYRLSQLSSGAWTLSKRTQPEAVRVCAAAGSRSNGMMYLGSRAMQAAFSVRDFWQKAPMTLEADSLGSDTALARLWLWSDEAPAMSFSAYDDRSHGLEFAYEGSSMMGHDPVGVANTNEFTVRLFDSTPTRQELWDFARDAQKTALLVASPEHYYESGACGLWSLRGNRHPVAEKLESIVDGLERFYRSQREQRGWYGFWNYGDVMHSYDPLRHVWRYDFGGCAWQNTELVPNLWLWDQFLRSGREETFELARAMTRHTSEVDCYHIGPLAGLGSRHNVVHWGCSAKEARIMMAFLHRTFYFLTADERVGELMELVADADYAAFKKCPMSLYYGKHEDISHMRSGPDWTAFASNWIVHEERFADGKYMEKLLRGLQDMEADELGLVAGPTFLYHPEDGHMRYLSDNNYNYHMIMAFGGAEVFYELLRMLPQDSRLPEMLAEFGRAYAMDDAQISDWTKGRVPDKKRFSNKVYSMKMIAWAAHYYKDAALGKKAWDMLLDYARQISLPDLSGLAVERIGELHAMSPAEECPNLTTNAAAQFSMGVFQALELIPEYLPE